MRGGPWPFDLSSEARRRAPPAAVPFVAAPAAGSFPFTAVKRDVGESWCAPALCSSGVALSRADDMSPVSAGGLEALPPHACSRGLCGPASRDVEVAGWRAGGRAPTAGSALLGRRKRTKDPTRGGPLIEGRHTLRRPGCV